MEEKDEEKIDMKIKIAVGIFLFLFVFAIIALVVGGSTLFSTGLLKILGIEYSSNWSIIKFMFIYGLILVPIGFFMESFLKAIKELKNASELSYKIVTFICEVCIKILIIGGLEWYFEDIEISIKTAILYSIIATMVSMKIEHMLDEDEKKHNNQKEDVENKED